jgi:hypothetical protein
LALGGTAETALTARRRIASIPSGHAASACPAIHHDGTNITQDSAMPDYSNYQKKVIQRYYDNRDQVDEQRLAELVTNLYLAEGKKRANFWKTAKEVMLRLNVPASRVEHVVSTDDPAILAEVVKEVQAGVHKKA